MQKLQSHDRDSLSKAGLRKRHWRSWTNGERLLLAVSVCMALLLVSLSGFILSRTDNKLVITTDPKLLSQAKFLQGAWLTFQSFCVMALMLPVWNCVTTIKSEVRRQRTCRLSGLTSRSRSGYVWQADHLLYWSSM